MIRIAKPTNPIKLAKLQNLINNDRYIEHALNSVADTLTYGMLEWNTDELANYEKRK